MSSPGGTSPGSPLGTNSALTRGSFESTSPHSLTAASMASGVE